MKSKFRLFLYVFIISLTSTQVFSQGKSSKKLLRHVVIFKFNDSSSAEDVQNVADTFYALKKSVPQIKDMEWGINNSPEQFNQGFTHCFIISFKSEKDLADYQNDPSHKAFQEVLKPHMEKVFVVDYWVK
ncbi:Dabb family protein [Lacihabitans sp. CS3-21]|uniref:Dabb family protein n=1 Tax=Lacihabitans sp. CS3-21 TaxID=2487332 RepID=UPI0020CE4BAA|nr:Dabb family protein [Lacihabitans sp. CS3-21]MCP9745087.1 Dabb family protein [Lacihabitans sp. CS3-21]